ncbi:MAG: cytochrome c oxidase accessory protein CcoG [Gammaproteobacteria bacterium]|nr:cytochrome c oxidase accessory protein CcoG [Gammaproteobacteria bacterium]
MSSSGDASSQSLYKKAAKIYPKEIGGRFADLRTLAAWLLLGIYYGVPWLSWDERQAVLFDLPNRKFYLFGLTLWPQDFIFLAMLLIIAGLALFFFTALAGRLWCGYACPQTVWTKVYIWMEKITEGDRNARMRLDKSPLSWRKFRIKGLKHTLWIVFALYTGFTFVGFFTPILDVWGKIASFSLGPWETFWIVFYSFATYGNAGWLREQICIYMCPYARFQGAMFDKDTLIISYDEKRGEPRGNRKRFAGQPISVAQAFAQEDIVEEKLGSCIDCKQCVVVCPTGIDIRKGLQYECIGCAACIDACDDIMDKMNYPRGLIRYSTEHAMAGGTTHVLRGRVIFYGIVLTALVAGFIAALALRTPLALDILRDRNRLYNVSPMGLIQNVYTLKVMNKDQQDHDFVVSVSGVDELSVDGKTEFRVHAGEVLSLPLRVEIDPGILAKTNTEIRFRLEAKDNPDLKIEEKTKFIKPANAR